MTYEEWSTNEVIEDFRKTDYISFMNYLNDWYYEDEEEDDEE